jgi:hypothetical protein
LQRGRGAAAGAAFNEGDVLQPKIANVKLLAAPSTTPARSRSSRRPTRRSMGTEQGGFVSVETAKGAGWVKKVLVTR